MKIYTGGGDRGKTSLFSGERVNKSDLRVEAYGDVDELNSLLGALVAFLPSGESALAEELQRVQSD
ncbi:MAG: ATP:cob(I)alamin adenosyltransferase, partial [Syntrophobacterales bacterium]